MMKMKMTRYIITDTNDSEFSNLKFPQIPKNKFCKHLQHMRSSYVLKTNHIFIFNFKIEF